MAAEKEPVDTQQPSNKLSEISDRIRKDLITRNNYGGDKNIYGATNKDAIGSSDYNRVGGVDYNLASKNNVWNGKIFMMKSFENN